MAAVTRGNPFALKTDPFDPEHRFETSWLLPPMLMFGVRAAISIYAFAVVFFIMAWEGTNQGGLSISDVRKSFSFFTILCYWGICFYFAVAATHTWSYALNGGRPILNRFPRILQALHYLFYTTIVAFPFLVTIVYWGVLFGGFKTKFELWSNVSEHALNSVFGLFELIFSRINPAPWIHLVFLVLLLCGYLGVAYITFATKHYYVYPFLNPNPKLEDGTGGVGKSLVVGYVFGIAAAIIIIFCVSKGLQHLRKWLVEEKLGMKGKMFGGRSMEHDQIEFDERRVWTRDEDAKE